MSPPLRSPSPVVVLALALAAVASSAACSTESSSSSADDTPVVITTAIAADPSDFLGSVRCSSEEGSLRSYVLTARDHTDPTHIVTLPSSPPTPCSEPVELRYIIPDHIYTAEIDGYEQLASSLVPLGDPASAQPGDLASGSRHMIPESGGPIVTPRWTTSCGSVTATLHAKIQFTDCAPLADSGSSVVTSIRVDPLAALGSLACAGDGGQVVSFDITPVDSPSPLPPITGLPCGAAPIMYASAIKTGALYRFRLEARAQTGGDVVWGSSCAVVPEDGKAITAACDPLASSGSIEISISDLLAAKGLSCGKQVATYDASIAKPAVTTGPVPCDESARIAPLPPGAYTFPLHGYGGDGSVAVEAMCDAVVAPGAIVKATCK